MAKLIADFDIWRFCDLRRIQAQIKSQNPDIPESAISYGFWDYIYNILHSPSFKLHE